MPDQNSILILGGGFAGWYAARKLASLLPAAVSITVIDCVGHMLYTPMLTEVAGGTVSPAAIAVSHRMVPKRVVWINAEIASFDAHSRSAKLKDGRELTAAHLVVALGSVTSYHNIDGAQENSLPFKTLADANLARQRIDAMVSLAATLTGPSRRDALTLIVAGGGYTGVETMAALYSRLIKKAACKGIKQDEVQAVLIEPTDRLMHEMPEPLAAYAKKILERDGVRVLTGVGVTKVEQGMVTLKNGEQLKSGLLVWDTGVEPSPLLKESGLPIGKHRGVQTENTFRVKALDGVWAIGDCAEIPNDKDGSTYAPTAQNAVREGTLLAKNIASALLGKPLKPFHYKMLGQLALISERNAVANILGVKISGLLAWAMWWIIYTAKLPGLKNRLRVMQDRL